MKVDTKKSPLVILGFDVGDADCIEQWVKEGYLPTIGSIMKRGFWGRLGGPELICEDGSALSLFSGLSRKEHGHYYSRQLIPGTYDLKLFSAKKTKVLPFWSHLLGQEKKVAVIDPRSCNPVEGLPGFQVFDWATHESLCPPSAEPSSALQEVKDFFGEQMLPNHNFGCDTTEAIQVRRDLLKRIQKKGELCRYLFKKDDFDLIAVTFYETHTASHHFWKYRPETKKEAITKEENELTYAIRDMYQELDKQLGLVLEQLPPDANICIYSLFGVQDQHTTTGLMDDFCRKFTSSAPSSVSMSPLALLRRLVPESLRAQLSHFLPPKIQERLLASQLSSGTNWQKTTAFTISSLFTGFLRVNLKGREPEGIVHPGVDYEALLDQLESDLKKLVDEKTGLPAVKRILRMADFYQIDPKTMTLPDLFVDWTPGSHFMDRVLHPKATLVQHRQPFDPGNEETMEGFFAFSGPAIQEKGRVGEVSLLDLAPTFLKLLGTPVPKVMTGQVLEGVL